MGVEVSQPDSQGETTIPRSAKLTATSPKILRMPEGRKDLQKLVRKSNPERVKKTVTRNVEGRRRSTHGMVQECMPKELFLGGRVRVGTSSVSFAIPNKPSTLSSATSTPIPGSGTMEGGSGQGGGNGGDGNGKKKKPSGEHPAVTEDLEGKLLPSPDVEEAKQLLAKNHNIFVEAVHLHPTTDNQQEYRKRLFNKPEFLQTIHELQQRRDLKDVETLDSAERVRKYYELQAAADAYKAGDIPEENLGAMFGLEGDDLMDLFCSLEGDDIVRKKSAEFAIGNGEISRTLRDAVNKYIGLAYMRYGAPEKGAIPRRIWNAMYTNGFAAAKGPRSMDPNITGIDFVGKFVDKASKKLINGIQADICSPPEDFFEKMWKAEYGLEPNSLDFIFMNLALDRLSDIHATLKIMKLLAKTDGSTQFMFGFYAPFSPETISFSKNDNIPEFDCFDPANDFRSRWMNRDRAETIYQIVRDLNMMYGFNTKRIAEHEYEVYSAHCIAEPAGVLRKDPKYAFLRTYDFRDSELNERRDAVFSGKIADEDMVGFPERENIILIAGNITLPEEGSVYGNIEVTDKKRGQGQRLIIEDPKDPKYAFLRDFNFGKKRLNNLRDQIFEGNQPGRIPYRQRMKAQMAAQRKAYLKNLKKTA